MKSAAKTNPETMRIAVQKSGRLTEKSLDLLESCGMTFNWSKDRLMLQVTNFPLEILLVRDDDIPEYVRKGICQLGVVGENVLRENSDGADSEILRRLGFGKCRLSIAVPEAMEYEGVGSLYGKRIATSYPNSLRRFLAAAGVKADIVEISGAVEITPALEVADAVCDLVSTGSTLRVNGLREVDELFDSESVIVRTAKALSEAQQKTIDRLLTRIDGVKKAESTKYVMMNAPRAALERIREILPGMEEPSVLPFACSPDRVAIHTVCEENVFWETMERLKEAGASSILVVPIEKILS